MFYEKIDILGFSLYEMCLLFIVWSFIGWAIEVCAHALKMGEYSNRGFLSMPMPHIRLRCADNNHTAPPVHGYPNTYVHLFVAYMYGV